MLVLRRIKIMKRPQPLNTYRFMAAYLKFQNSKTGQIAIHKNAVKVKIKNNLTCRHDRLHPCAVDERPFDGLCPDIGPVDAVLYSVEVQHRHVVDVGHSEGDDVVVVGIVDVNAPDLNLTGVQEELAGLCVE